MIFFRPASCLILNCNIIEKYEASQIDLNYLHLKIKKKPYECERLVIISIIIFLHSYNPSDSSISATRFEIQLQLIANTWNVQYSINLCNVFFFSVYFSYFISVKLSSGELLCEFGWDRSLKANPQISKVISQVLSNA